MPDQRLVNRYSRRLNPGVGALDRLAEAIHALLQAGGSGDPFFLSKGLELLVTYLGASQATLVMMSGGAVETRWWYPEGPNEQPPAPVPSFCEWLMKHPERILVVRDIESSPHARNLADPRALFHKAALGCALRQRENIRALLFVFFGRPRVFPRAELALLEVVAGYLSRILEIEDLKQSLNRLEDSLAISKAVMEDSSTLDSETDLPNLRYLEIWRKTILASEHRPESLVVAECQVVIRNRRDVARIRKAAESLRAGDLVVRLARDRFLIILQHTSHSLAHIPLLRLRTQLNCPPMGATLWVPGPKGQGLESCQPRLDAALVESRATALPTLVWRFPEGFKEEPAPPKKVSKPAPGEPQRWQPITLETLKGRSRMAMGAGQVGSTPTAPRARKTEEPPPLTED